MLVGLKGECCKKFSLHIHQKCYIILGLVIRDQYYCCRDCHLGEMMTGDGYPYKFVTFYENEDFFFKLTILLKKCLLNFFKLFWV